MLKLQLNRKITKKIIFLLFRITVIPLLVREFIQRNKVTIILFHDLSKDRAERYFKWLKKKYNIIPLSSYLDYLKDATQKLPSKSLIITFDDGHKNNYELLPIIKKLDIPITIFLCSGIINTKKHFWFLHPLKGKTSQYFKNLQDRERLKELSKLGYWDEKEFEQRQALNYEEIKEMIPHVDFQAHTVTHPILPQCDLEKSKYEIIHSKRHLEAEFNLKITSIAFPNGDFSNREIEIAKDHYQSCLTLEVGYNSDRSDPYKLKRLSLPDDASLNEVIIKTSGIFHLVKAFLNRFKNLS